MTNNLTKNLLSTALLFLSLFVTGHANATLNSSDYISNSGDNWITYDSDTGLQWLDVTLTTNQTFDQVRQGEWFANGFRYATKAELQTLFINAGTPEDENIGISKTYYYETKALIDLLGVTIDLLPDRLSTYGYIGTDFFDINIDILNHPIGEIFSAQLGKLDFFPDYGAVADFYGGHPFSNEASPNFGSFLVRTAAVPEPESYMMILTGLGLISFMVRVKKEKSA
jgi:hypothetical protein